MKIKTVEEIMKDLRENGASVGKLPNKNQLKAMKGEKVVKQQSTGVNHELTLAINLELIKIGKERAEQNANVVDLNNYASNKAKEVEVEELLMPATRKAHVTIASDKKVDIEEGELLMPARRLK